MNRRMYSYDPAGHSMTQHASTQRDTERHSMTQEASTQGPQEMLRGSRCSLAL
jgi:hypothetical protein